MMRLTEYKYDPKGRDVTGDDVLVNPDRITRVQIMKPIGESRDPTFYRIYLGVDDYVDVLEDLDVIEKRAHNDFKRKTSHLEPERPL